MFQLILRRSSEQVNTERFSCLMISSGKSGDVKPFPRINDMRILNN
jgi:hypothetical protein